MALAFILLLSLFGVGRAQDWPISDTNYTDAVQWDHYSMIVNGQRTFLLGGEMHPFRIPVPELWNDILQKMKAMGMNSMSFYSHWGYHEPLSGELDFATGELDFATGAHNLTRLLEYASENGLFVTPRPGPYINGELSAGGLPLWITTGASGDLRSNSSSFTEAWEPYMSRMAELVAPFQIHRNGTVISYQIENEFAEQWTDVSEKVPNYPSISYMKAPEANARENGIHVPFTHNTILGHVSWAKDYDTVGAGGNVDIHGFDSYPLCWSCDPNQCSTYPEEFALLDYLTPSQEVSPNNPVTAPEFQGGKVVPRSGYPDGCADTVGPEFRNIYYRHNVDQRMTIMMLYMTYGGTSWGWLGVPFLGTSYDYSAPIAEDRSLRESFFETKNLALFTRVAHDLAKTDRLGSGTNYTSLTSVSATELRNPDTDAAFYIVRHNDSTDDSSVSFKLNVTTSLGNLTIPQIVSEISLSGHTAKILVTDFDIGGQQLIYSTAEILTTALIDGSPTVVLWVASADEAGEAYIAGYTTGELLTCDTCDSVSFQETDNGTIFSFYQGDGLSVAQIGDVRVIMVDKVGAYSMYAPVLTKDPLAPVNETILVHGPHLVRTARVDSTTLHITGDLLNDTTIDIFAPSAITTVTWNGNEINVTATPHGSLTATLPGPPSVQLPPLGPWKFHDSLPEVFRDYSDDGRAWINANHNTTANSEEDATIPYLYADDYGFHAGSFIYRGRFNDSTAAGAFIRVYGGEAFGFSAYLNGAFLDAFPGGSGSSGALNLTFPVETLMQDDGNVLTVVQDNSGHDQGGGVTDVRGILSATLLGSDAGFSSWKLAGTAGRTASRILDPVRGAYNEGGWTAERLGWHLPGFDDGNWPESAPSDGFANATVRFYRTTVPLEIEDGVDLSIHFKITSDTSNATTRALLYVNGYQYGRFAPYVNSATRFPVHPGILNFGGDNVIGVLVWAQSGEGAVVDVSWDISEIRTTSLDAKFDAGYLQPRWNESRLEYV